MGEMYLSDNAGHRVPPAGAPDPVHGTGQKLTVATDDTDAEATVIGGAMYAFTAVETGGFFFGILDVTTAANVAWVCPLYQTIIINIPSGTTILHYGTDVDNAVGYLRKLTE